MVDHRFHRKNGPFSLKRLAEEAQAELRTDNPEKMLADVATIDAAQDGDLTFLDNRKYLPFLSQTKAGACIIHPDHLERAPQGLSLIITKKPYMMYARLATLFYPQRLGTQKGRIAPTASVAKSATIGEGVVIEAGAIIGENAVIGQNTLIGANSVIGDSVQIGEACVIHPLVTLSHALIGSYVTLFPGVRVGQPGFGYAMDASGHVHVPQLGRVIIEDHVEIGANCTIDRGAGPDTVIGAGSIIDNLVQIAHNVRIGKGCVLAAQVGVAGSTVLGDFVVMGGQAGVAGHLKVGSGARIGAQAGVLKDIAPMSEHSGTPAVPVRQFLKQAILLGKLANKNDRKEKG